MILTGSAQLPGFFSKAPSSLHIYHYPLSPFSIPSGGTIKGRNEAIPKALSVQLGARLSSTRSCHSARQERSARATGRGSSPWRNPGWGWRLWWRLEVVVGVAQWLERKQALRYQCSFNSRLALTKLLKAQVAIAHEVAAFHHWGLSGRFPTHLEMGIGPKGIGRRKGYLAGNGCQPDRWHQWTAWTDNN